MSGSTPLSNRRTISRTFRNRARDARLARRASSQVESLESRLLLSTATFSGPGVYPVRPFTKVITLADFNGDGKPDIAGAVSQGGGAVVTLLNNGNGTFSQPFYFAAGIPRSIAAADFNHDGRVDLAVAGGTESNTANVQIFFGNGDGTFVTPPARYPLPGGGQAVMATDLNGDGFADLLIATASRIAVLMNNGNGTFAKPVFYNTGGDYPKDLAVADFNNDGVPDIAISGGRNQRVAILLGNRSTPGTFGPPIFLPASSNPQQIAVADFNHDGNEDIAVVSSQFQGSTVNVLLGNGNGTFRPPLRYTTQANFSDAIVSGDFTGTGLGDLVVGSFTGNLKLFAGNGDGTFAPPQTIPDVIYAQYLQTADLNGDGKPDLAVTPHEGVKVLLNTTGAQPLPLIGPGVDKAIGTGASRSFAYYAPDGTLVTVSLSGPGSATLHFSASTPIDIPSGRRTVPVTALQLSSIIATGTTGASMLSISANYGSRTVALNSITTDGAFGAINAPVANVNGAITLPGGAKTISLLSANGGTMTIGGGPSPAINLMQAGNETLNSAVPIRSIQVAMDAGVSLTAPSVGTFSVAGSLINSTLDLTAPTAARAFNLQTLSVGRGITGATIQSAGNIATISAQDMSGSTILAGVAALPPAQGLPAAPGDFASSATLASIVLARSPVQPSFSNSNIAAFNFGNLQLGNILMNNAGAHFGVAGHQVGTVVGTDLATRRSFTIKNATSTAATAAALQARGINPQDFEIVVF